MIRCFQKELIFILSHGFFYSEPCHHGSHQLETTCHSCGHFLISNYKTKKSASKTYAPLTRTAQSKIENTVYTLTLLTNAAQGLVISRRAQKIHWTVFHQHLSFHSSAEEILPDLLHHHETQALYATQLGIMTDGWHGGKQITNDHGNCRNDHQNGITSNIDVVLPLKRSGRRPLQARTLSNC